MKNVAIAGATGAVGIEFLKLMESRNFPVKNLKLLASKRSVGKELLRHSVHIYNNESEIDRTFSVIKSVE